MATSRRTAIVFLTHVWHEAVARRFERLRRESAAHADCFVLLDAQGELQERWVAFLASIGAQGSLVTFAADRIAAELGFRHFGMQRLGANTHFPLLGFARSNPQYEHLWQVEFDVEYRGSWSDFFTTYAATDADLLGSHFHRWSDWPEWFWWSSLTYPQDLGIRQEEFHKAFLPIMRLSRAAIACVERAHRQGWMGHYEAIVPTVLLRDGHRIEDLNARGNAYMGWFQDPVPLLPLLSTIRCRPPVGMHEFMSRGKGPLVFHPVKEAWTYDGERIVTWSK